MSMSLQECTAPGFDSVVNKLHRGHRSLGTNKSEVIIVLKMYVSRSGGQSRTTCHVDTWVISACDKIRERERGGGGGREREREREGGREGGRDRACWRTGADRLFFLFLCMRACVRMCVRACVRA